MLSSCLKDNDEIANYPQAALTMVNAYTPSHHIYHRADNNSIQTNGNPIQYKAYTYAYLFPGNRKLSTLDDANKTILDTTYSFKDSTYYTSFVYGNITKSRQLITQDKFIADLGTKTGLRFFHLANNQSKVNVYLGTNETTAIYPNRIFEGSEAINNPNSTFTAQTSGKQKVTIKDENNTTLIDREYDFVAGKYYSIILIGDKNSTDTPLYLGIVNQY